MIPEAISTSDHSDTTSGSVSSRRVYAIIVTYYPDLAKLSALLDAATSQVSGVVIVDNGSAEQQSWLRQAAEGLGCELLPLARNMGVAAAHNLGIAKARQLGAAAVVLLDQDSVPSPTMVARLQEGFLKLERAGQLVAAVGPCHTSEHSSVQSPFVRFGLLFNKYLFCGTKPHANFVECDHLISSGCFMPTSSLDRIGDFDEGLFVDNVDTEWCFRAQSKGYKLFGVCSARMLHAIGETSVKIWMPFVHDVVVHKPVRLYYIVRNHILLYRRNYTPNKWIMQDIPRLAFKVVVFGTSISPRASNLRMMMIGFRDGIRGRTGPYEGALGL